MSTLETIIKCYFPAIPGSTIQWANKRIKGEELGGGGLIAYVWKGAGFCDIIFRPYIKIKAH